MAASFKVNNCSSQDEGILNFIPLNIPELPIVSNTTLYNCMAPANATDVRGRSADDKKQRTAHTLDTKTWRSKHYKRDKSAQKPRITSLAKRQDRTDKDVSHPPPVYTPTVALHASTIPWDGTIPTSQPTSTSTTNPTLPALAAAKPHGTNVGLLVVGILASGVLVLLLAALGRYLLHRKAEKIRLSHPRFSMMWNPRPARQVDVTTTDLSTEKAQMSAEPGQFVYISNSDGELNLYHEKRASEVEVDQSRLSVDDVVPEENIPAVISRRHSSPPTAGANQLRGFTTIDLRGLTASRSAPTSPDMSPAMDREASLWIQRQKAAELAQIVRMRIVREQMPVHKATSCPDLDLLQKRASVPIAHGLGIMQEEQECDIATTAASVLQRYSVAVDSMSPNIPIASLFHIDNTGGVVRTPSPPSTPALDSAPDANVSSSSSEESSCSEGDSEDIESAMIVQMAQARSMEIKRGVLVSMDLSNHPPMSRSAPMLLEETSCAAEDAAEKYPFPSAPPSLSPIVTSPTSLSADIEHSLEERVFAYRNSGAWSKAHYKLTTLGQVRALAESLNIARPPSIQTHPERGWPWPAHRTSVHSR